MNPAELTQLILSLEPEAQQLIIAIVDHLKKHPKTAAYFMSQAQDLINKANSSNKE